MVVNLPWWLNHGGVVHSEPPNGGGGGGNRPKPGRGNGNGNGGANWPGGGGWGKGGKNGGAPAPTIRSFNGSDNYIVLSEARVSSRTYRAGAITVCARIRLASGYSASGYVLAISSKVNNPANIGFGLRVDSGKTITALSRAQAADVSAQSKTGATALSEETEYTVFAIFNYASNTISIYIDDASTTDNASTSVTFSATTFLPGAVEGSFDCIGAGGTDPTSVTEFFEGVISDVAVYRYALSQTDREFIAGGGRPDQVSGVNPVCYWPMDSETDLLIGGFANPRVGGVIGISKGTSLTTAIRPPVDAHATHEVWNRFRDHVRSVYLRAADFSGVGTGNTVTATEIRGAGVSCSVGGTPTYQTDGSGRSYIDFVAGSSEYLEIDLGRSLSGQRGVTVIALLDSTNDGRICSMATTTTTERTAFGMSPSQSLMTAGTTNASFTTYTDYTAGSDGVALFSSRYSGNETASWLNGVKRTGGTVTNATELSDESIRPTNYAASYVTGRLQVGRRQHSTTPLYATMKLYGLMVIDGILTDEEVAYLEAWMAYDCGYESVLDAGHTWAATEPTLTSTINYPWGNEVVARSFRPQSRFVGEPTIERHDGVIYAAFHYFGDENERTQIYRRVGENDWRGVAQVDDLYWPTIFTHTDGNLYAMGCDRAFGNIVIKKSTDKGITWTSAPLSNGTLLTAAGSGTTAPNYNTAGQGLLYYDGFIFFPFENLDPNTGWSGNKTGVLYIDATDDLMTASNWSVTSQLAIGAHGYSNRTQPADGNTVGFLEGNIVLDGSTLYNVLRWGYSTTPDKALYLPLSWSNPTLTLPSWNASDVKDLPGGNVRFQMRAEGAGYAAITNDNTAVADVIGSGFDQDQRNHATLVTGTSLSSPDFAVDTILINKTDVIAASGLSEAHSITYHGFQYPVWKVVGSTRHIVWRCAWSGANTYHNSNFIGYSQVAT